jgi:hypothetical protein
MTSMALGGVARDQEKSSAWCAARQHRLIWNPSTLARVSIVNVATPIRALCAISSDELAIGTDEGVAVIALSSIDA